MAFQQDSIRVKERWERNLRKEIRKNKKKKVVCLECTANKSIQYKTSKAVLQY